jgi:hypothetical protein
MSVPEPEQVQPIPSILPDVDDPLSGGDALTVLQTQLEGEPGELDLILEPDSAAGQPIGRSWAFDFHNLDGGAGGGFVKSPGALSPLPTSDMETLRNWVVKCLNTARGAHPIHPPGYGLAPSNDMLIGANIGSIPGDLFDRIEEALTFHPRITSCEDFEYEVEDPDDDVLNVSFTIVLDDDTDVNVPKLGLSLSS